MTVNSVRPNKNDDKYKNLPQVYFSDTARWALFNASNTLHEKWLANTERNQRFFMGDQWWMEEDIQSFLKDETGDTIGRIQFSFNQIRKMTEQYRGNGIRLAVNARAESISNDVKNRREFELGKKLLKTEVADEFPALGQAMRAQDKSIGETVDETQEIFENTYVDRYVKSVNQLIEYVAEQNEMQKMQLMLAQNLSFAGLGTIHEFEYNGQLRKEVVQPDEFGWDRRARRYDLQDAAYQFRAHQMLVPEVLERWNGVSADEQAAIERFVSRESDIFASYTSSQKGLINGNSIPVYQVFWRDTVSKKFAYVDDGYGYPYLAVIGEEDKYSNGKTYTDNDIIAPPDTPANKKIFKNGKRTAMLNVDILRYCIFTPGEIIGSSKEVNGKKEAFDIVYEYGDYEYQETQWRDLSVCPYPFKSYCWAYVNGEVASPMDDAIDPQRFLNRVLSGAENQVNNSGGAGFAYDADALDTDYTEEDVMRDAKMGKPIKLRTRGKGVPNTIMPYDNTPKAGTYNMFGLLSSIMEHTQNVIGINEGLTGESTGQDQLVGVTKLMIQRGSLQQEPFYNAMAEIIIQSHQYTATIGKRIYIDNERELAIITGDDGVEIFKMSEEIRNEDFRVFIKRDSSNESLRDAADGMLFTLLQSGIIDKEFFSALFGRCTVEDIQVKLRQTVKKEKLAAQMAAKEQQAAAAQIAQEQSAQQAQMAAQVQQKEQQALTLAVAKDERDKEHEREQLVLGKVLDSEMKK